MILVGDAYCDSTRSCDGSMCKVVSLAESSSQNYYSRILSLNTVCGLLRETHVCTYQLRILICDVNVIPLGCATVVHAYLYQSNMRLF